MQFERARIYKILVFVKNPYFVVRKWMIQQDRGQSPVTTPRPQLNPTIFSVPKPKIKFGPFLAFFWPKQVKIGIKNIFSLSRDQMIFNEGSHAYVRKKFEKMHLGHFWPLFRPKLVKMTQNCFFLASDAKLFPTRGHIPMLEKKFEKMHLGQFLSFFRPKLIKMAQNHYFPSRIIGNNQNMHFQTNRTSQR